MSKCSEHEKIRAIKDQSQACGDFVEWLRSRGMMILIWRKEKYICERCGEIPKDEARSCRWDLDTDANYFHKNWERCDADVEHIPEGYYPIGKSIEQLLAEFFEIDLDKLEAEKRAMLDECRALNTQEKGG